MYQSLSEHIGIVVILLGVFAGISGFLFWNQIEDLKRMVNTIYNYLLEEREKYVTREECERCAVDKLWNAFDYHKHTEDGKVIRG